MSKLISLVEASKRVIARANAAVGARERGDEANFEVVPLEHALGRRLAEDQHSPGPWPMTDRSAMDGFAFATGGAGVTAGVKVPVVGEALAGHPFDGRLEPGQSVRIMTGGVVPEGADTVVMVEHTDGFDGSSVQTLEAASAGSNIRLRGSEIQAGELLLASGVRIRAAEIGALAVLGRVEVPVYRRPKVAILSTGDEIVPIDADPAPEQVRNSNAHALAAQVRECGGEPVPLGICADTVESLRSHLTDGLRRADIVLTIGGVSKGTHDLVHGTLRELGVCEVLHGITLKPGKPVYFGQQEGVGAARGFVFGLPGNPASAFTTFDLLVRPLLLRLGGAAGREFVTPLRLADSGAEFRKNWRTQAIPARVAFEAGELCVSLASTRPSGDPFGICDGDGYAMVPADVEPGSLDRVDFVPFDCAWP